MISIDLCKQQAFNADSKAIQQINFSWNLKRAEGPTIFLIIEEAKEIILDFSQGIVNVLWMSLYDLARVAKISNRKIFDYTVCSTIYFPLI